MPPLLVPSILWGGGDDSLHKVPLHTFGQTKKRFLRLKPINDNGNDWLEVALVDHQEDSSKKYYTVKAASPLALIWSDPNKTSSHNTMLSSPFKKRGRENEHEILLQDITQIVGGNRTAAFQAFIAKNGNWSVPPESCCFSLISAKRSVDFFVLSASGNVDGRDAKLANAWRDAIQTLLDNFHRKQNANDHIGSISPSNSEALLRTTAQRWNPKLHSTNLFEAAKSGDIGMLRWFFDHGCPIDFMDATTGDSVLMVACRLGLFDVARLALLGYHARNDCHPEYGQTALQVAVSAGHTSIARLILAEAEHSGADQIISNHEDENGEAPLHVAARCGSIDMMELLVAHGANLGLVDGRGRTCLHCAAQAGHPSCLTFALDSGADEYLEVVSNDGFTPLHLAVRANKTECVKILLQAGADASAENVYNLASKQRSEKIMKLLLEYDISKADSSYDGYNDEDGDSSLSEEDMFRGLNTYTVSPAVTAKQTSPSSQFAGTLVSPSHPLNYYNAGPLHSPYAGSSAPPLHSHWPQIIHSPIIGSPLYSNSGGDVGHCPFQQNEHRFEGSRGSVECNSTRKCGFGEGEEFVHGGEMWKSYVTHDGHRYYYNTIKDTSAWELPGMEECLSDPRVTPNRSVSFAESHYNAPNASASGDVTGHQGQVISYKKKLTAIPLPGNTATFSAGQISQPSPLLSANAGRAMGGLPLRDVNPPSAPVSPPVSIMADVANLKPANANQASKVSDENQLPTTPHEESPGFAKTCPAIDHNVESNSSPSSEVVPPISEPKTDERAVDPKSILLSQMKAENTMQGSTVSSEHRKTDPKHRLLSQIKSHGAGTALDNATAKKSSAAQTGSSKPGGETPGTRTAKENLIEDPIIKKYIKMGSVGIPLPAICHKMKQDGIEASKVERFCSYHAGVDQKLVAPSPKIDSYPETQLPKEQSLKKPLLQDEAVKKFMRMVAVGVPAQAVAHKMTEEGVDGSKINMFREFHGLNPSSDASLPLPPPRTTPTASSKSAKNISITKEDLVKDSTLKKYVKMSTVGVPVMAIVTKMSQDGIAKEKIHMFSVAFGLKISTSPKPFPMPPLHRERRRASKALQKIHWSTVAEDRLQNSLWASTNNAEDEIKDSDIAKLESLFSASPTKKSSGIGRKKAAARSENNKNKSSLIDPKRANNIAIALAQFRAFSNFDDLCQAVASLDREHLNTEKLQNMQLLLPQPDELARLKNFDGQGISLGRAELFFLSVMKVPRFPQKLSAFKYFLQFDEQTQSISEILRLIANACDEVVRSQKLAGILRRLLAIGNIMNESAGKPKANGITLDSLIKTAKKKGSDGKTTILDHLISTAMNDELDIVDFWSDMPAVRDAMRLDLGDVRLLLQECESGAQSITRSIETEKSQSVGVSSTSEASKKFLNKLEPFLHQATGEIENVKSLFSRVEGKVRSLCSFFAEDFKTCKASTIFRVLLDFSRLVDKSKEQHIRKVKAAKRREVMAKKRAKDTLSS